MKTLIKTILTLLIILLSIIVSVILITAMIDSRLLYSHLIFSSDHDYPKMHIYTSACDRYANVCVTEDKYNMVLIITLQNYRKGLSEEAREAISHRELVWRSDPKTWNYADFYPLRDAFDIFDDKVSKIGVRLYKNSLVIIDGVTNETLLVHKILPVQTYRWDKDFWEKCRDPDFNMIEDAFKMFSVSEEKRRWYTRPEVLSEDENGSG